MIPVKVPPAGPQGSDQDQSTLLTSSSEATAAKPESEQTSSQPDAMAKKEERLKRLRELHLRRVCFVGFRDVCEGDY